MGFRLENIERGLSRMNAYAREVKEQGQPRRDLSMGEGALFDSAAYERPPTQRKQDIIESVRMSNPVRWARLNREYKWFQKQLKKRGLSPEDARYLL